MSTKIEQEEISGGWRPAPELPPSSMREDEPRLARAAGLVGFFLVLVGLVALLLHLSGSQKVLTSLIPSGWDVLLVLVGLGGLLFHAARDRDLQVRRMYVAFGYLWLGLGAIISLIPKENQVGYYFLPWGLIGFALGLLFLMAFTRQETEESWRRPVLLTLGGVGVLLALIGFIFGSLQVDFLLTRGLILMVLGLVYWWAFVAAEGTDSPLGFRAAVGMGILGLAGLLAGLAHAVLPVAWMSWGFMPGGLLLMVAGAVYVMLSAGMWSDNALVVLTRRELATFFYSPIAYIVLIGFTFIGWWLFISFVLKSLWNTPEGMPNPMVEPIVANYFVAWFPVICTIFVVPVLTMRLLSEEKRTGTIEVILTAPVGETVLVLSKFLAALIFFLLLWVPWGLFLLALRVEGGQAFDYRPLLGFLVALTFSGAGFLSMGLFFSSLTQNQVGAAILTFAGMFALTFIYFPKNDWPEDDFLRIVFDHVSYIDLWINSMRGKLAPRDLVYNLSVTTFWLFLTVKVLESRKWR